jgi:hypothetical protein
VSERTPASREQLTGLKNHELWTTLALTEKPEERAPIIAELKRRGVYSYTDDMGSRPAWLHDHAGADRRP